MRRRKTVVAAEKNSAAHCPQQQLPTSTDADDQFAVEKRFLVAAELPPRQLVELQLLQLLVAVLEAVAEQHQQHY